jgi:hypothetical protein
MRILDAYDRREELLSLLYDKPMPTAQASIALDLQLMEVKNDIAFLKKFGLLVSDGRQHEFRNGRECNYLRWRAKEKMCARDIESLAYARKHAAIIIPDLPQDILLMMGYTTFEPKGGEFVNNSHMRQEYHVSKVRVSIGNHWGIMMEASQ